MLLYKNERVFWETGTTPKDDERLTVKMAIDAFLVRLESKSDEDERKRRHFEDCKRTALIIVKVIDKMRLVSDLDGEDFYALRL